MDQVTHINDYYINEWYLNKWYINEEDTHESVMLHIWMIHVTHVNEGGTSQALKRALQKHASTVMADINEKHMIQ